MISPNADRNKRTYRLWEKGYTIDQAAAELPDIARSTIGYYYRKFNEYAKEGRPIAIPQARQERVREAFASALTKTMGTKWILEMVSSGQAEYAYYVLALTKLMRDLALWNTPEESEALRKNMIEAIEAFLNMAKKPTQTPPQVSEVASKQDLMQIFPGSQGQPGSLVETFRDRPRKSQNQQQHPGKHTP